MEDNHAALDRLRKRLHEHAPALHDAAAASLTPKAARGGNVIAAVRAKVAAELGDRGKGLPSVEQRAGQVGLAFLYDLLYRYESSAGTHPTLHAVDLLLERSPRGLVLRGEPTAQFAAPPVYLHGAHLLYEALNEAANIRRHSACPSCPPLAATSTRSLSSTRTRACRTGRSYCRAKRSIRLSYPSRRIRRWPDFKEQRYCLACREPRSAVCAAGHEGIADICVGRCAIEDAASAEVVDREHTVAPRCRPAW
jgi:hypothetical protein